MNTLKCTCQIGAPITSCIPPNVYASFSWLNSNFYEMIVLLMMLVDIIIGT